MNSQIILYFFLRAFLIPLFEFESDLTFNIIVVTWMSAEVSLLSFVCLRCVWRLCVIVGRDCWSRKAYDTFVKDVPWPTYPVHTKARHHGQHDWGPSLQCDTYRRNVLLRKMLLFYLRKKCQSETDPSSVFTRRRMINFFNADRGV